MKYIQPTHIFVLGDIFSFQYLSNEEFEKVIFFYIRI